MPTLRHINDACITCLFALIPFSNAFAPVSVFPIPYIVFLAILPLLLIESPQFPKSTVYLLACTLTLFIAYSLTLSLSYSIDYFSLKAINHFCAAVFIAIFALFCVSHLTKHIRRKSITKGLEIALVSTSVFIIAEVILGATASITLGDLLPRPSVPELNSYYFGILRRPRGFAEEPGLMAVFFEFAIPTYLFFSKRGPRFLCTLTLAITAWTALLSTASIIGLVVSVSIYVSLKSYHRSVFKIKKTTITIGISLAILILSLPLIPNITPSSNFKKPTIQPIETKIERFISSINSTATNSSDGRANRYKAAYEILTKHPLGIGWGTAATTSGQYKGIWLQPGFISLPLEIIVSFGIIGIILITLLISPIIHKAATSPPTPLLFSTIWVGFHFLFISNYWLPWPWLAYGLLLNSRNIPRK